MCGLSVPEGVDGKVITPIIKGESDSVRTSLFTVYRNTVRAVRTKQWKLIRYPERDYTQLFNLASDPLEINNLATLPESKSTVDSMTVLQIGRASCRERGEISVVGVSV